MCYAIPGKLVKIDGKVGIVDYFGEKRKVLMDLDDAQVGDYVYAQGGVLISKITEEEALETLEFWKDRFFELKKVDEKLAKVHGAEASKNVLAILQKANLKQELSRQDIITLLKLEDPNELKLLYETANNIRQRDHDNACCVHGILEFSNHCSNDCHYCGIHKSRNLHRYRMSEEEILSNAKHAIETLKFKAIVLQSGEDGFYTAEMLARIVTNIRNMGTLVFLSIGMRSKQTYKQLYDAGARAILLRFETSDRNIFATLRPGTDFDQRIDLIKYAKSIGYLVATGFMIGLPGETQETIADNILLTKQLGAEMHSFGPLIPAEGTPLANEHKTNIDMLLKIIAISRLTDRKSKILVTTAMETLDPSARKRGLLAGGNSMMLNLTPEQYRKLYAIYPGRADNQKEIKQNIDETTNLLYSIGRAPTDIGL